MEEVVGKGVVAEWKSVGKGCGREGSGGGGAEGCGGNIQTTECD